MSLPREQAWFHVKTHGYGWGLPVKWQGWIALLVYVGAMVTAGLALAKDHIGWFLAYTFGLVATLVALCFWKGEAPQWRWGGSDEKGQEDEATHDASPRVAPAENFDQT